MVMRRAKPEPGSAEDQTQGDKAAAVLGHNSGANMALLGFAERFERLTEEIQGITEDRKEVMGEAKAQGFDTKILRQVIRRRAMDRADRQEQDALLELYEKALDEAENKQHAQSVADGA